MGTELSGRRFGRLTALFPTEKNKWMCQCDCGISKEIYGPNLRKGHTKSCGCLRNENVSKARYIHGGRGTRIYRIWCNMKSRCYNENVPNFMNYGGRGIAVCDEWRDDFTSFQKWSKENGYKDDLLIDRIDNNGNYEPSNCRWTSRKHQNLNRRNNVLVTIDGITKSFSQWADEFGINRSTALSRVYAGMTEQEALTIPVTKK